MPPELQRVVWVVSFAERERTRPAEVSPVTAEEGRYFLTVPVSPSGEQLNGSIFRSDGAYSLVERGNGCVKKTGSVRSISTTSRLRAASTCSRSTEVNAAEWSSPLVG